MSTQLQRARLPRSDGLQVSERILDMYAHGASVPQMMAEFGMKKESIVQHIHDALENRVSHKADEAREVVNKGIDQQLQAVQRHLEAAEQMIADASSKSDLPALEKAMAHHLKAIEARTRILERRAKLNGLDAPVRIDARVEMTTPADAELQALLNEAHQRADADRDRLAQRVQEPR